MPRPAAGRGPRGGGGARRRPEPPARRLRPSRRPGAPNRSTSTRVVRASKTLMRRLVDDHIELSLRPGAVARAVEGERAVLEEALVNLAVAAGDALPAGGRVRIATASRGRRPRRAPALRPGEYVALSLIDARVGRRDRTGRSRAPVSRPRSAPSSGLERRADRGGRVRRIARLHGLSAPGIGSDPDRRLTQHRRRCGGARLRRPTREK